MGEADPNDGLGSKRRKLNDGYAEEDEYDDEDEEQDEEEDYQYGSKHKQAASKGGASNKVSLPKYQQDMEDEGLVQSDD